MTKTSTKLNHFVIAIHKLFRHGHAQNLVAILKVMLQDTFFQLCVVETYIIIEIFRKFETKTAR